MLFVVCCLLFTVDLSTIATIKIKYSKGYFMKKNLLLHILLITGILFHSGCMKKTSPNMESTSTTTYDNRESTTESLPEITGSRYPMHTIDGQTIIVGERNTGSVFPQYPEKIVLLQIFGKDCSYCFEEIPMINNLRQQYPQKLQVIAIQAQDRMSPSTASRIISQYQMDYPIIEADEATNLLLFLNENYGWTGGLPFMQLIKNGVTEYTFSESPTVQELQESVESLL